MEKDFFQVIDYRFYKEKDVFVVWIAGINRYLQLHEPAFRVFEQWASGIDQLAIADTCCSMYSLSEEESKRFVKEITGQVQALMESKPAKKICQPNENEISDQPDCHTEYLYQVGTKIFRFIYRNCYLGELFHPLFRHYEIQASSSVTITFELYTDGGSDFFRVNDLPAHEFPVASVELFQGAVYMEMLNVIHGLSLSDWMAVLHASAVTDGEGAVIFVAPSGGGKSSIAMLMMAHGYSILSDDFVPLAMIKPEVYHFPAGISVKPASIPFLKKYLPQIGTIIPFENTKEDLYLPPQGENGIHPSVVAKAIVFVIYDTATEYNLQRESNLEMMNRFISQSWVAGTSEAAECFLAWYFNLPVYTLQYSNNTKAVLGIKSLFK